MILLNRQLLPYIIGRITGDDGHYTAFRLAFCFGGDPRDADNPPDTNVLAQFDFPSPWAAPRSGTYVIKLGPITTTITASGIPSHWRLVGFHAGAWSNVVHGSIGLIGSGADINVRTLEWVRGDPLTLQAIRIFPLKLSY